MTFTISCFPHRHPSIACGAYRARECTNQRSMWIGWQTAITRCVAFIGRISTTHLTLKSSSGRPSKRRMDIDNRAKAVMDALQELRIIADDCLANRVTMMWSLEIECVVRNHHNQSRGALMPKKLKTLHRT